MLQRGDKIFYHTSVDLEILGTANLQIAGIVTRVDARQIEILSYWGSKATVDADSLTPRTEDEGEWYAIDHEALPE